MILDLAAVFAAMLAIGGALLGVAGVIGTTKPRRPPSAAALWARRWWTGPSRNRRDQRARQFMMIGSVAAGVLAWLVTGWPAAGLIVGVAVPGLPWLLNSGRMEKRALARLEAVEAWTRRLSDIVARGIGLQQAIVATNTSPPQLIAREVADLAARMQSGTDPVIALRQFADDLDDYTADQVVAPLMLHVSDRSEGLSEVLTDISRSIAAEVEMRSTVDAKRAGPRFAVKFLTAMTIGLLVLGLLNPAYLEPFGTFFGQMLLLFLAGLYIFLMRMARNLSLPPVRPRLLPPLDLEGLGVRT
jgi:Flp pilus assembly protein TadB